MSLLTQTGYQTTPVEEKNVFLNYLLFMYDIVNVRKNNTGKRFARFGMQETSGYSLS